MTVTYHTPISFAAPVNSAIVNLPLGQLDAAIAALDTRIDTLEGLQTGAAGFTQLNLSTTTTLNIASGVVTISRSRHLVDTESSAASDDLDTISGQVDGDLLFLQTVNAGRVVTVKHNSGNIFFADGSDRVLSDPRHALMLIYDATNSRWIEHKFSGSFNYNRVTSATEAIARRVTFPDRSVIVGTNNNIEVDFTPPLMRRNRWAERAAAATYAALGIAAGTTIGAGALTEANDADTTWVQQAIAGASGTFAGRRTSSFDLVRTAHDPIFEAVIKTGAAVTGMRFWIGLFSTTPTNVDTLSATSAIAARYSSVVPDAGWVLVASDAATQTVSSSAALITTATMYKIRIRVDSANGIAYLSVNDSAEVSVAATLPATTTELGGVVTAITTENVAKTFSISRYEARYN